MPGPVVNGVRQAGVMGSGSSVPDTQEQAPMIPLMAEGAIRLILLCSGDVVMARLRHTTDRDGDHAYQLCLLYTSPSPRDRQKSRMPSSA